MEVGLEVSIIMWESKKQRWAIVKILDYVLVQAGSKMFLPGKLCFPFLCSPSWTSPTSYSSRAPGKLAGRSFFLTAMLQFNGSSGSH